MAGRERLGLPQMLLGDVVDALKELTTIRLLMQKETEAVEAVERKFKMHLIDSIPKSNAAGAMGLRYKAVVKTERIPKVKDGDWQSLHQYIYDTGHFDLLQKSLSSTAVMARLENGETIPGIETMLVPKLSITKI